MSLYFFFSELLKQVHAIGKTSKNIFSSAQNFSSFSGEGDVSSQSPVISFKAHLIRLIGNLCHNNPNNQDKVWKEWIEMFITASQCLFKIKISVSAADRRHCSNYVDLLYSLCAGLVVFCRMRRLCVFVQIFKLLLIHRLSKTLDLSKKLQKAPDLPH